MPLWRAMVLMLPIVMLVAMLLSHMTLAMHTDI